MAGYCSPSVNCIWCVNVCNVGKKHKRISISSQNICSQLNGKLSPFYQYVYTLTVMNTSYQQLFSPFQEPELVSNLACIKKQGAGCIWDWPYPLTNVSNVIRDASNISREINTFRRDSSTHNPSNVLLYCTEQFKEAKIFLKSSFDYSTKLYSKEEAILINSQSLS